MAEVPDLKSWSAFGATPQQAVAEVGGTRDALLAAANDVRRLIPRPAPPGAAQSREMILKPEPEPGIMLFR